MPPFGLGKATQVVRLGRTRRRAPRLRDWPGETGGLGHVGDQGRACFDGERFRLDGVTVLVEGERIIGVEPLAYDVPADVEVTAYDGTLLPGLIDSTSTSSPTAPSRQPGAAGTLALSTTTRSTTRSHELDGPGDSAGVTTVRDLGDVRYRTLVARDRGRPASRGSSPPARL